MFPMMQFSLCSLLLLIVLYQNIGGGDAFISPAASHRLTSTSRAVASAVENDAFFRAVECAEGSRSTLDELVKLASELEDVDGCKFEEGQEDCDKEIRDRMDVAQILRLRIELQLRTDYLKKENLFASDVHKSHDAEERKRFKEMLQANREKVTDGSDLGLW